MLSRARFAGGCPAFGRERSSGGGGETRLAAAAVEAVFASEVIANCCSLLGDKLTADEVGRSHSTEPQTKNFSWSLSADH